MDREALIAAVNEKTSGSRSDYLTVGDVTQIVDAVLAEQKIAEQPEPPTADE
jgi:uncharacterized protein YqfA (UPF0365 family)